MNDKAGLTERGSAGAYDSVEYHITRAEYPLAELASYFADPKKSRLNAQDANIFVHSLQDQASELWTMAAEIDESYQHSDT